MNDYTELVKALRYCQFGECGCVKCYYKELKGDWCTEDNHPEFFDCDDKLKMDAADAIEALQAEVKRLEPKRGEWLTTKYHTWKCSVCGKNPTTGMGYVQTRKALYNYCPNCGAKMEEKC